MCLSARLCRRVWWQNLKQLVDVPSVKYPRNVMQRSNDLWLPWALGSKAVLWVSKYVVCVRVFFCVYAHIHTYTFIHRDTYTHIHMNTLSRYPHKHIHKTQTDPSAYPSCPAHRIKTSIISILDSPSSFLPPSPFLSARLLLSPIPLRIFLLRHYFYLQLYITYTHTLFCLSPLFFIPPFWTPIPSHISHALRQWFLTRGPWTSRDPWENFKRSIEILIRFKFIVLELRDMRLGM